MRQDKAYFMNQNTEQKILTKFKKAKGGTLFFSDNFASIGQPKAIHKALERLTHKNEIIRIAKGVYIKPKTDPIVGIIYPNIEAIAEAIAKRDKAKIVPTGSYALYKLGLSTQIPMNIVFFTDASARKINIGKQRIQFKKASAKSLAAIGEISKLVIQALKAIGKDAINETDILKIQTILKQEKPYHLQHDAAIAPVWMRPILLSFSENARKTAS